MNQNHCHYIYSLVVGNFVITDSVNLSVHLFTDLNASLKKSRWNTTKRPKRGNMSMKKMRRMRFFFFSFFFASF